MGRDPGSDDFLKIINAHSEVDASDAFDAESDRVRAGVKNAVCARHIVLELEQVVAVVQRKNIFGLPGVDLFHLVYPHP